MLSMWGQKKRKHSSIFINNFVNIYRNHIFLDLSCLSTNGFKLVPVIKLLLHDLSSHFSLFLQIGEGKSLDYYHSDTSLVPGTPKALDKSLMYFRKTICLQSHGTCITINDVNKVLKNSIYVFP